MINRVCAIVVTYNRKKLLVECINSLLKQTYPIERIYLIDNASTDGTGEEIKNQFVSVKKLEYILLKKNIGGAGGFEVGIKTAIKGEYDWIWIMDDDTIPDRECLEKLLEGAEYAKEASFFVSNVYGIDGLPMNVPKIASNVLGENGYSSCYSKLDRKMVAIEAATFVSLLVKTEAIQKVGFPCGFFFIWGDDTEYTLRLSRNCGNGYLVGDSKVLHKRSSNANLSIYKETNEARIKFYRYNVRNMLIIKREYWGILEFLYEFVKNILIIFKLLFSRTTKKKEKVLAISGGIIDFVFKRYDYKSFLNRMPKS